MEIEMEGYDYYIFSQKLLRIKWSQSFSYSMMGLNNIEKELLIMLNTDLEKWGF